MTTLHESKQKQVLKEYISGCVILGEDELNFSVSLFEPQRLLKDDFFIRENYICDKVAFIVNGGVRAFNTNIAGEENVTCFKFENNFITSYESLINQHVSKKSIQAIEDCDLLVIKFQSLQKLLEKIPAWKIISQLITEQEFLEKENYLIHYKKKTAKEKYLHVLNHSSNIVKRVKVNHLASYLGITQRSLTRAKKELTTSAI